MTSPQIAQDITDRINRGDYAPGAQLESYAELAGLYDVSVPTIANVMRILRAKGVVIGIPGKGVFVPHSDDSAT